MRIILEEVHNEEGKYLGRIEVDMTPELFERIKKDKADKMGYKKYRKVLKEKGYNIE